MHTKPNVYMSWCMRESHCEWGCNEPIEVATPTVRVSYWNKGNPDSRGFNTVKFYHPQCWIAAGLDYLKMNPYRSNGHRGRPNKEMSVEDKSQRVTLMRRKAALEQQKSKIKAPYPEKLLMEARLDDKIAGIMMEISQIGGIPEKWIEKLLNQPNL